MGRHIRDNTDAAAQEADDYVTEHGTGYIPAPRYEIFGTSTCDYCDKAKELLTALEAPFVFYNIDEDEQAFDQLVGRIKSWKTVPQIFFGAKHIGGYDDLKQFTSAQKAEASGLSFNYVTVAQLPPPSFVFTSANKTVMTITPEGELIFGEGMSQSEAAQQAAKVLLDYWLQARGFKRNEELLEANNRYLLRARAAEELLQEAFDRFEPTDKDGLVFAESLKKHLEHPWR